MRFILKYILIWYCALLPRLALADVNLATILPTEGYKSAPGSEIFTGVQVAVNEINQSGGLLGNRINLIPIEDTCNDSLSVSTAEMIALNTNKKYKLSAIIGPYCSNQFQRVSNTFAKAGIFQLLPVAVNGMYNQDTHSGLIKMVGFMEQQATDFYNYYQKNFDWMSVALIYDNDNQSTALAIQELFYKNNKINKLHLFKFDDYDLNYNDIAKQAIENNTQLALILSNGKNAANMTKKLKSRKKKYLIFVNRYQTMPEFEDIAGNLVNQCYFIGLPSLENRPEFTETLVRLRLLGIEPKGLAIYGYYAVKLWENAVKKAKSFDYNKLSKVVKNESFNIGWGDINFINGSPSKVLQRGIFLYKDKEYTQVY